MELWLFSYCLLIKINAQPIKGAYSSNQQPECCSLHSQTALTKEGKPRYIALQHDGGVQAASTT